MFLAPYSFYYKYQVCVLTTDANTNVLWKGALTYEINVTTEPDARHIVTIYRIT